MQRLILLLCWKCNDDKTSLDRHTYLPTPGEVSHIRRDVWSFGEKIGRMDLADIVVSLYDAALQQSSRKTYRTGQRAYLRFVKEVGRIDLLQPYLRNNLDHTELSLAFYMA